MRIRNHALTLAIFLALALLCPLRASAQAAIPPSSHVVLLIEENTSYSTTQAEMPWLVAQGSANGHATNYFSNTSGSLMDYLWLASGSCHSSVNCVLPTGTHGFGCSGAGCTRPITDDNIFREMNNLGISWKVYAQSYAAAGGTVTTPDNANGTNYYRRHNGATWYSDILSNVAASQARIVDFSQFAADLANDALPQFTIIVPDGLHDAHNGTPAQADAFLKANLTPLLAKSYFQPGGDGLLIITFDNGDSDVAGQVYTAMIGPNVSPNVVATGVYHHENTLRTMLDALEIQNHPGASANAAAMYDFFSGYVTINSPVQNATLPTQVLVSASATEANAQIYQVQVWDDTTGQKLGESAPGTSSISQAFTFSPGTHRIIVQDISALDFSGLHLASATINVTGNGVSITSPAPNATTGTQLLVSASASESNAQIYQLQVWDDTTGQKLGQSAPGTSTINQTFPLALGRHRIIVEDISAGNFADLHLATVNVTIVPDGVTITAPAANAVVGTSVPVSASAVESNAAIYQLQVWDNTTGAKLGQSAPGTSTISQTYSLSPGTHQIIVVDISAGTFQELHQASVTVTVSNQ